MGSWKSGLETGLKPRHLGAGCGHSQVSMAHYTSTPISLLILYRSQLTFGVSHCIPGTVLSTQDGLSQWFTKSFPVTVVEMHKVNKKRMLVAAFKKRLETHGS